MNVKLSKHDLELASQKIQIFEHYSNIIKRLEISDPSSVYLLRLKTWLNCSAATILGKIPTQEIVRAYSECADTIVKKIWSELELDEEDLGLFALGKLGSGELNLSSDIDLIAVSKNPPSLDNIRKIQRFSKILSSSTENGFLFRTDFDLRPGGSSSSLIVSLSQAEDYYWSYGATWERLALIRARPLVGNNELINDFQELFDKFIYRKFINYKLLEDLKSLRPAIHGSQKHDSENYYNLKTSPGGIRDIELFVHALQVIYGGKNPSLRTTSTEEAIKLLLENQIFSKAESNALSQIYWRMRHLENYVQSINDQQIHHWEKSHGESELHEIKGYSNQVNDIVSGVIGTPDATPSMPGSLEEQKNWLSSIGFNYDQIKDPWESLVNELRLNSKTYTNQIAQNKALYLFMNELSKVAVDSALGVHLIRDFLNTTKAKSSFLYLFIHQPKILRDLARVFGVSPYFGGLISARPELLDSLFHKTQVEPPDDWEDLLEYFIDHRLLKEVSAITELLEKKSVKEFTLHLTETADFICESILAKLKKDFPKSTLHLITLGKWGSQELGLKSDLDFVLVTQSAPIDDDHKVAKRFLSRLTAPHKGGGIYSVDLRLRPSGQAGPILTSQSQLETYLAQKAQIWERQSYQRARYLGGTPLDLKPHIYSRALTQEDTSELKEIRSKLLKAFNPASATDELNLKYSSGGLIEIEFTAQIWGLTKRQKNFPIGTEPMLQFIAKTEIKDSKKWQRLLEIYDSLRIYEQLHSFVAETAAPVLKLESSSFKRLAKIDHTTPQALYERVKYLINESMDLLKELDPLKSH